MEAVVFDLWDTLVPFDASGRDGAVSQMATSLGIPAEAFTRAWDATRPERFVGSNEGNLIGICRSLGFEPDPESIRSTLEIRNHQSEYTFHPREDAVATLAGLRGLGLTTGLITNCSSEVPALWPHSPLAPLMDVTVFSCEVGLRKPDPAIFLLAAERLRADPAECIYVGDGADDELPGAASVGMTPVMIGTAEVALRMDWQGSRLDRLSELLSLSGL